MWAPATLGALIAAPLILLALVEAVLSRSRWDDHLIHAFGVLGAALFVSVFLWLATGAFWPLPGLSRSARLLRIGGFLALVLLIAAFIAVCVALSKMRFL